MTEFELKAAAAKAVEVFLKYELEDYSHLYDGCKITDSCYEEEDEHVYVDWQTNTVSGTFRIEACELDQDYEPEDVPLEIGTGDDCYESTDQWDNSVKYFWISILKFP